MLSHLSVLNSDESVMTLFHVSDKITEYFGVKIGMYFGYLGHYTKWLVFPAFLGLALWLLQGTSQVHSLLPQLLVLWLLLVLLLLRS